MLRNMTGWCSLLDVADGLARFRREIDPVIALAESGALEAQGNLRRPRFSEVRLPAGRRP